MIDTPHVTHVPAQIAAVIRVAIPPSEMRTVVGPGITELMKTVAAQGVGSGSPWFIHMLRMTPDTWEFEIGVPVKSPVAATGRVKPGGLPAARVARTVHHGGYEGIGASWGEFDAWVKAHGHKPATDQWDVYLVGPESGPDESKWRTQMNRPLLG